MEDKKLIPEELNDDQLDAVAGGIQAMTTGRWQITTCDEFVCVWCGHKKASAADTSHICAAQSGMGATPSEWIETVYENNCEECTHRYTCGRAYTYVGLGSPTP